MELPKSCKTFYIIGCYFSIRSIRSSHDVLFRNL